MTTFFFVSYLITLGIDVTIGILRFHLFDKALKVIFWMLLFALFSEIIASYFFKTINTKAPVYHFFSIVELTLAGYFFLYSISIKPKTWLFLIIAVVSIVLGIGNLLLFQSIMTYNTNMLMIECILTIGMALYALFDMMKKDEIIDILNHPHFRIWTALLIMWTGTFFFWAFLSYLKKNNEHFYKMLSLVQALLNILVYAFMGYTFYKIKDSKLVR